MFTTGSSGEIDWLGNDVVISVDGADSPYTYTARRHDTETGLMQYRTRYYWPEAGRFVSVDSIGVWGDPNSLGNGYAYVGNMGHRGTDAMGRIAFFSVRVSGSSSSEVCGWTNEEPDSPEYGENQERCGTGMWKLATDPVVYANLGDPVGVIGNNGASINYMANTIEAERKNNPLTPVVLVGHSWGGFG